VALCQTIPGATVMQMAAYIGLKVRGLRGAMVSYIGFGLPAFLLMLALSFAYAHTHELPTVVSAFSGLQAVIVAVVANATLSFGKISLKNWKSVVIALVAAGLFGLMANPVLIILLAALLGMLLNRRQPTAQKASQPTRISHTTIPLLLFLFFSAASLSLLFFLERNSFTLLFSWPRSISSPLAEGLPRFPSCSTRSWKSARGWTLRHS